MVTLRAPIHFYYLIADQFGTNLYPQQDKGKDTFTVTVPVAIGGPAGDQFFGWILSMGQKVMIVDPPEVKRQIVRMMSAVLERYDR